jgi:hypothetical protein
VSAELPPLPLRWYCVSRDGLATLCKDEADARMIASDGDRKYPRGAPYRAVLLGDAAAAVAAERAELEALRAEVERLRAALATIALYSPLEHGNANDMDGEAWAFGNCKELAAQAINLKSEEWTPETVIVDGVVSRA